MDNFIHKLFLKIKSSLKGPDRVQWVPLAEDGRLTLARGAVPEGICRMRKQRTMIATATRFGR